MKCFISTCNIQGILYNINKLGTINPYTIGNPLYFSGYAFNIFTSIPIVPKVKEKFSFLGRLGNLGGFGRFIIGLNMAACGLTILSSPLAFLGPIFVTGISLSMYGSFMMASTWDSQIKADMDRIGWDPFTSNPEMTFVNKVSFYKGQSVVLQSFADSSFSAGIMFLHSTQKNKPDTVKHEWGHFVQLSIMGPLSYAAFVALPSVINFQFGRHNDKNLSQNDRKRLYYSKVFERSADYFGGIDRKNYDPFWTWSNFVPW